jgi:phosphoserine phosphatase
MPHPADASASHAKRFADGLPQRGWLPANHRRLTDHLGHWAQQDGPTAPLAIFDWDNTCVFNDVAEATVRYQLQGLHLRLTPEELRASLPTGGPSTCLTYGDQSIRLAALQEDLLEAYGALWPAIARQDTAVVRDSAAHQDFCCKVGVMYHALEHTPQFGPEVAYPWLLCLYRHFSEDEVERLAQAAWLAAAAEPIGTLEVHCASAGAAGKLSYSLPTHVHLYPEIAELMASLQLAGVEVGVVTASYEPIVRGIARLLGVVPQGGQIVGMRPADPNSGHPITYRQGKVDAIWRYFGRAPVLVAGDATTDYEMLTGFAGLELRLLIHRGLGGPIAKLYAQATQPKQHLPPVLLQGRELRTGHFWPREHSG